MRAAASRSGGPQACPAGCARHSVRSKRIDIRSINHCSTPSAAFLSAIAFYACCGLPQPRDGSLECCRYGRALVAFVVFCDRQSPRRLARLRDGKRELAWVAHSLVRCLRALRPASTRLLSPITPLRHLISASYSPKNVSASPCGVLRDDCGPRFAFLGRTSFRTAPPTPREPGRNRI